MRPFVRYYDIIYGDKNYNGDVNAFAYLADVPLASAKVLEIGAGTGSQSMLLAQRGAVVTAVEIDPDFAEVLRRKVAGQPRLAVHFGDVGTVATAAFDAAAAFFHVLNYIEDEQKLIGFLRAIAARLKPGAPLVADIWNGDVVLTDPPKSEVRHKAVAEVNVTQSITPKLFAAERRVELTYDIQISPTGQPSERFYEVLGLRLWLREELERAFAAAGFGAPELRDYRNVAEPATSSSWRIWLHARRTTSGNG